jgi:hypothetical protein
METSYLLSFLRHFIYARDLQVRSKLFESERGLLLSLQDGCSGPKPDLQVAITTLVNKQLGSSAAAVVCVRAVTIFGHFKYTHYSLS